jgi:hypothetical protein
MDPNLGNDIVKDIDQAESLIIKVDSDGSFTKEFSKNFPKN